MNIFLLNEDATYSAELFHRLDPVRARKQLLEGCQMLATIDHILHIPRQFLKKDGQTYSPTHANHPCITHAIKSVNQYLMLISVTEALAKIYPKHSCSVSYYSWAKHAAPMSAFRFDHSLSSLLVVRKNHDHVEVSNRQVYSTLMLAYLKEKLHVPRN